MKVAMHGLFLIIFFIIQVTWLETISILGIKPNLFIIYIVVLCCFCKKKEGAVAGFFFGLVLDFAMGEFGLNAVLLMLAGMFTAFFCEKFIRKNSVFIVMLIVMVVSVFYELLYYIVSFVGDLNFKVAFLKVLIPECIYNSIFTMPIYGIVKKLSGRFWKDKGEIIG